MLNVLRKRAAIKSPVDYTDNMIIKDHSKIEINFILDERAREMCGEYQRWFDLKRTGKLGERIKKYDPDIVSFQSGYRLRPPIPLLEMQSITNASEFKQSPGF